MWLARRKDRGHDGALPSVPRRAQARMVPSAQPGTRAEGARMKYERHCVRPDAVEPNSALPRYGWIAQHALYPSLAIVLKAIYSFTPDELPKGRGRLFRNGSVTKIAARTARFIPGFETSQVGPPMPHRTVAHCLEALVRKGFLVKWEVEPQAPTSPFGTHWRLPLFDEILQKWADDPKVGTVGDRRAFYVIGKGKRHLSPEEIVAWKLDHAKALRLPAAQASAGDVEEPLTASEAKGATLAEEIEAVHAAMMGETGFQNDYGRQVIAGVPSEPEHATKALEIAREAAPGIPVSAIGELIHSIRIDKWSADKAAKKPNWCTAGWILTKMAAAAHAWRHRQSQRAAS